MVKFFSYFSWFQIVLLMVGLMSGILSLFREVYLIRNPEKTKDTNLLWRCLFIAYIISSFWLWIDEHTRAMTLQAQLDEQANPR